MSNPAPNDWRAWRVAPAAAVVPRPVGGRFAAVAAEEVPGPDGIRWALVARVRADIAAGRYDDPEIFAAAEAALFRRACSVE